MVNKDVNDFMNAWEEFDLIEEEECPCAKCVTIRSILAKLEEYDENSSD